MSRPRLQRPLEETFGREPPMLRCILIIRSLALLLILSQVAMADALPPPAQTRPTEGKPRTAGRDTPEGAMNVMERAIAELDAVTLADSFDESEDKDRQSRLAWAQKLLAERRLFLACEERFGHDTAMDIFNKSGIDPHEPARQYKAEDWELIPGEPDLARGREGNSGRPLAPLMHRGADGIWRNGGRTSVSAAALRASADRLRRQSAEVEKVTAAVKTGVYTTADDLLDAISTTRKALREQRARENRQGQELAKRQLDTGTISGAVGAYALAFQAKDPAAMAKCFFAEGDQGGKLARANAERIASATRFVEIATKKVDPAAGILAKKFGLISDSDAPWWASNASVDGDRATARLPNGTGEVHFRKVNGAWLIDITPPPPATVAERIQQTEKDRLAVDQITTDIVAGKYKKIDDVRDALAAARLALTPDPDFARSNGK